MKQVKVDNWGIYFLQRLKHFFNRTDYCDLTLQFMDNAQLKVHRLVLNACTEYFDVLERTCEMYEDHLVMPDDLQADVVVPIVNFMYTGQLEYKPEMLEKLIQTAHIMNIPVLAKLLDAQRQQKTYKPKATSSALKAPSPPVPFNHPLPKAFKRPARTQLPLSPPPPSKKPHIPLTKKSLQSETLDSPIFVKFRPTPTKVGPSMPYGPLKSKQKYRPPAPRPTRCELPEDLEENIFTDSFSTISYDSRPLIVHPETTKRYAAAKQHSLYTDVLSGRKSSTIDIIHNKIKKPIDTLFEDLNDYYEDNLQLIPEKSENKSFLFDQVVNDTPKVTIESEDDQQGASIDHAKIISEVLKKYPYLVKGNKSIKLKILDTKQPTKAKKTPKKAPKSPKLPKVKQEPLADEKPQYPADMLDSKEAAHLISLGAENVSGPWICMICGTPGKALSFSSYYSFRRHLVEVHHEKIVSNRCEHCGYKTNRINYLLHHLYTKHNVPPPQHCNFPKCSECGFIAQNSAHLVKHKMMHSTKKNKCSVCYFEFTTAANLMRHIKATGHKSKAFAQHNVQCVYCLKMFVREQNLYVHLKSHHGLEAKRDGIVEDSDEEHIEEAEEEREEITVKRTQQKAVPDPLNIKREPNLYNSTYDSEDSVEALGTIDELVTARKPAPAPVTQRLLNASFEVEIANQPEEEINSDGFSANITVRDSNTNEFILPNSEFTQNKQPQEVEYYIAEENEETVETSVSQECSEETPKTVIPEIQQPVNECGQQVQIVVSNEEEYKALMASNHPIIFDADGNPTKTLAVLTTPQSVAISSMPMQVENENSENMMILPAEYGCVQQSSDDGNIVVVYSQQIDGENKQYIVDNSFSQQQLVSAADMNTHFIRTSSVLTPSYTSTTPSTLVQGQVVIPQTIVSWDGNVAQEIVTQQSHSQEEIEIMQEQENMTGESTEMTNKDGDEQPIVRYEIQEQTNNPQGIEGETDSQDELRNDQVTETESLENDVATTDGNDSIQLIGEESRPQSPGHDPNTLNEDVGEEQKNMEILNNIEEAEEEAPNNETEQEATEVTEAQISTAEVMTNGSHNDEYMKANDVNDNTPKENIENLTSEWSDDEVDNATIDLDENGLTEALSVESMDTAHGPVVEESIENIQQEVDNHNNENEIDQGMAENELNEVITENELNQEVSEIQESEMPVNVVPESATNNLMKTQHKITSLLNDWIENDSQEEDEVKANEEGCIEGDAEGVVMEEGTVMEIVSQSGTQNVAKIAPNPDIKTLVNDWDEEEETNE